MLKYLELNYNHMKIIYIQIVFYILSVIYSCNTVNSIYKKKNVIEIVKIDSIDIYYIFNTNSKQNSIFIGEKEKLTKCLLFKKYLIKDSIKETPYLKDGGKKLYIGFHGFEIDDIIVKKTGELVKYINSCESFID